MGVRRSLVFILVSAVVIIGGAIGSAVVAVDCPHCIAGFVDCAECRTTVICPHCAKMILPGIVLRSPDCPECGGSGVIVKSTGVFVNYFEVECGCRGKNPECPICGGKGTYPGHTTGMCEACQGRGGKACPHCGGDGKIQLREKAIGFLKR